MRPFVVIAAFNEEARLPSVLAGLAGYDVAVVDDGSSDQTAACALRFPVWVLRHPVNCGQGAALRTGIAFALQHGAEAVVTFDADGQHDPADIPRLLAPLEAGEADVALGSRFLGGAPGIPGSRKLLLKAGVLFTRLFSGVQLTDTHNGLRALSRKAAQAIRFESDRMAHASELIHQLGVQNLRHREVPVTIRYNEATLAKGQGGWNAVVIALQLILGRLLR
jgi:glycosyltransferase involved in cell wall biosynthesis